jgi:hypothetical protein
MNRLLQFLPVLLAIAVISLFCTSLHAQASATDSSEPTVSTPVAPTGSRDALEKRIEMLEAQLESMRTELSLIKAEAAAVNGQSLPAQAVPTTASVKQDKPATEPRPGFDLGPVHVVPYGTLYVNLFGNSGGNNNADVPIFASPTGSGGVSATARQTRLGLRFGGPEIGGGKSSGVVEADFNGGLPSIGNGEDSGVVRMRVAFFRLDWKNTSLEVGQDWTVFSPNNPVSLASLGTPEFAAAGNLWSRIPQVRLQQRWFNGKLSWDGAILGPRTGDYPAVGTTPAVLQPGAGSASRVPAFESRIAFNGKNWLGSAKPGNVGISGHYGRARAATTPQTIDLDVVGVSGDWNMPLSKRVTFTGEGFFGRNLAAFQGEIFQTFVPDFAYRIGAVLVPGGPRSPGTRGGWGQLGYNLPILEDRLTVYAGAATDDPRDEDFVSTSRRDSRIRNRAYEFSFIYKFNPQLSWGIEYRRLETLYIFSGLQNNNHLNLSAAFSF